MVLPCTSAHSAMPPSLVLPALAGFRCAPALESQGRCSPIPNLPPGPCRHSTASHKNPASRIRESISQTLREFPHSVHQFCRQLAARGPPLRIALPTRESRSKELFLDRPHSAVLYHSQLRV